MIRILYCMCDDIDYFRDLETYNKYVSERRREKIKTFRYETDRKTCLMAGLLFRMLIEENYEKKADNLELRYNKFGKPFLKNANQCFFSITHTKKCAAVALSDSELGIDAEIIGEADVMIAKNFFNKSEYISLLRSDNRNELFFDIWTKKEAFLKMLGVGLSTDLSCFNTLSKEMSAHFFTWKDNGHIFNLYSDKLTEDMALNINKVGWYDISSYFS